MLLIAEEDSVRCLETATCHLRALLADRSSAVRSSTTVAFLTAVLQGLHALQRALAPLQETVAGSKLMLAAAEGGIDGTPQHYLTPHAPHRALCKAYWLP